MGTNATMQQSQPASQPTSNHRIYASHTLPDEGVFFQIFEVVRSSFCCRRSSSLFPFAWLCFYPSSKQVVHESGCSVTICFKRSCFPHSYAHSLPWSSHRRCITLPADGWFRLMVYGFLWPLLVLRSRL